MKEAKLSFDFDYIWQEWIIPLVNEIPTQMDEKFKEYAKFEIRDLQDIKANVKKFYLQKLESIKKEYYGDSKKHFMDFHKLSAILCRSLIEYKVYNFDTSLCEQYIREQRIDSKNTDWLVCNALVNFRLAFYSSVVLLYQSMLFNLKDDSEELYVLLRDQRKLNLYTSKRNPNVHESFENSLVLDLAKRDVNNRSFDCFLYSTILYQLEEYNKIILQHQVN